MTVRGYGTVLLRTWRRIQSAGGLTEERTAPPASAPSIRRDFLISFAMNISRLEEDGRAGTDMTEQEQDGAGGGENRQRRERRFFRKELLNRGSRLPAASATTYEAGIRMLGEAREFLSKE